MEDKKAISMKILSTDEKGYNFEYKDFVWCATD